MSIGDNIRAARRACNMTQAELAEKVGLSRPTIALYEAGKRELTASQIVPFARVLDTSPLFLLEGTRGGGLPSLRPSFQPRRQRAGNLGADSRSLPCRPSLSFCFVLFYLTYGYGLRCIYVLQTVPQTRPQSGRQDLSAELCPQSCQQHIHSLSTGRRRRDEARQR